jgi:hypothetical protein
MKKLGLTAKLAVMMVFAFGLITPALAAPDIDVWPSGCHFGDVEAGTKKVAVVTVQNMGMVPVEISVDLSGSADFSCDCPAGVVQIPVFGVLSITVTFAPSAAAYATASLDVGGTTVSLGGMGVANEPPPSVSIADILAFFDESAANGTLVGKGSGKSANFPNNALRNMIEAAGDLIDDGHVEEACQQLLDAHLRCDGLSRPPDFVAGPAARTLAAMILGRMADLVCQ